MGILEEIRRNQEELYRIEVAASQCLELKDYQSLRTKRIAKQGIYVSATGRYEYAASLLINKLSESAKILLRLYKDEACHRSNEIERIGGFKTDEDFWNNFNKEVQLILDYYKEPLSPQAQEDNSKINPTTIIRDLALEESGLITEKDITDYS